MYQMQFVATTSAGWSQAIAAINSLTDGPLDLSGTVIELEVQSKCGRRELFASTANGTIQRPQPDVFQWVFPPDRLRSMRKAMTYDVGCRAIATGGVTQLFVGTLALIDGEVS